MLAGFVVVPGVVGRWVPRRRGPGSAPVVYRTVRVGLRVTRAQWQRCFGLLRSAGDVWVCVLGLGAWHRRRRDRPVAGYQQLCRELAAAGPGTFGELDSVGARSVLRRYWDAWFGAAGRRRAGESLVRFPRRRRRLVAVSLVPRHVHLGRPPAAAACGGRMCAVVAAAGPGPALPARTGVVGDPAQPGSPAV